MASVRSRQNVLTEPCRDGCIRPIGVRRAAHHRSGHVQWATVNDLLLHLPATSADIIGVKARVLGHLPVSINDSATRHVNDLSLGIYNHLVVKDERRPSGRLFRT